MNEHTRRPLDVITLPTTGIHLIEASAGTGKTFTITSLVLRMLVERGLTIDEILAVTFTNAATAELKERIFVRLSEAQEVLSGQREAGTDPVFALLLARPDRARVLRVIADALRDIDRASVFTIHGFAARMLKEHPFESGVREDAELHGDQRALVEDVVKDFWVSRIATLDAIHFQAIGGAGFFTALFKVGLTAAASFEVPRVPVGERPDLHAEAQRLQEIYAETRTQFLEQGPQVLADMTQQLRAGAYKANMITELNFAQEYAEYRRYFSANDPHQPLPQNVKRWTQSKLLQAKKAATIVYEHPLLTKLEEFREAIEFFKTAGERFGHHLRWELAQIVEERVLAEHQRNGTQSFDSLLSSLCLALRDPERGARLAQTIRSQIPVALIDEFQDTDPVQYEIFERIYRPGSVEDAVVQVRGTAQALALYLIGDPKQSIYAFRGADVFTYLRAARHASGGIWTLATSYRASPRLVAAQNALYAGCGAPFGLERIVYDKIAVRPGGEDVLCSGSGEALAGMVLLEAQSKADTPWAVAQEIARYLRAGHRLKGRPVVPADIAVLTRTNAQAAKMQALLRELRIPAVMHGDRSVFESAEAMWLYRILQALSEPGRKVALRNALATPLIGCGAEQIAQLDEDLDNLELWVGRFASWAELWRARGFSRAIETLMSELSTVVHLLSQVGGERTMTNLRHLIELLHEAEASEHLGVFGLLRYLREAITDTGAHAMAAEARQLRLESDAQAITLTTAHKSKGLEYNIVFLPTLGAADFEFDAEAYRYFDARESATLLELRGSAAPEETLAAQKAELRQESLRLAYVALTRAKHQVVAAFSTDKQKFSSLSYLLFESLAPQPGGLDGFEASRETLESDARRAQVRRLAQQSAGAISMRMLDDTEGPAMSAEDAVSEIKAPPTAPVPAEQERTSSFSAMTRSAGLSRKALEGQDRDEVSVLLDAGSLNQSEVKRAAALDQVEQTLLAARCVLADFPRGAGPGEMLHAIFEHGSFLEDDQPQRKEVVQRELMRRGLMPGVEQDAAQRCAAVETSFEHVLRSALSVGPNGEEAFCLAGLDAASRFNEMEFSLKVGNNEARLRPAALAALLRRHDFSKEYVDAVARLSFHEWSGFLRGFIDLVYVYGERIFALDYKSNHLGDCYADYNQLAMQGAMEHHHYLLQALIYCVAIHRYGRARIANYSFAKNFGGMQYLFLRGMHPQLPNNGVYYFPVTEALVEETSQLFDSPRDLAGAAE